MTGVSECISVLLTFERAHSSPTTVTLVITVIVSLRATARPEPTWPPVLGLEQAEDSLAQLVGRSRLLAPHYHGRLSGSKGPTISSLGSGHKPGQFDSSVARRSQQV